MATLDEWIDTLLSFKREHPSLANRQVVDPADEQIPLPEINDDPELGIAVVLDI